MTLKNPETGEKFGHPEYSGPLTYIGALSSGRWLLEVAQGDIAEFSPESAAQELYPYLEPVEPLERGQLFKRTRHDFTGIVAEVLCVFPGRQTYSDDQTFDHMWVAYHQHGGAASREPKLRDETTFRRLFGLRADESLIQHRAT